MADKIKELKHINNPSYKKQYKKICTSSARIRRRHLRHIIALALPNEKEFFNYRKQEVLETTKILEQYDNMSLDNDMNIEFLTHTNQWQYEEHEAMEEVSQEIIEGIESSEHVNELEQELQDIFDQNEQIPDVLEPPRYNLRQKRKVVYNEGGKK